MHALPTMVRSFSRRAPLASAEQPEAAAGAAGALASSSQEGELLPQGSPPSDAALAPQKSHRSSSAAQLTSISVVVGAGVEPSSRSAPDLAAAAPHMPRASISFNARGWAGRGAGGAPPLQLAPSRLARSPGVSRTPLADLGLESDAAEAAAAVGGGGPSPLARQLSPAAAAIAAASAAAAQTELRRSLASHRDTMASTAPSSFSFPQVGAAAWAPWAAACEQRPTCCCGLPRAATTCQARTLAFTSCRVPRAPPNPAGAGAPALAGVCGLWGGRPGQPAGAGGADLPGDLDRPGDQPSGAAQARGAAHQHRAGAVGWGRRRPGRAAVRAGACDGRARFARPPARRPLPCASQPFGQVDLPLAPHCPPCAPLEPSHPSTQVPPEELEKMQQIERHIRKNQLKVEASQGWHWRVPGSGAGRACTTAHRSAPH